MSEAAPTKRLTPSELAACRERNSVRMSPGERAYLGPTVTIVEDDCHRLLAELDAVTAERDRFRAALKKHGTHGFDCRYSDCRCGLTAALEARDE